MKYPEIFGVVARQANFRRVDEDNYDRGDRDQATPMATPFESESGIQIFATRHPNTATDTPGLGTAVQSIATPAQSFATRIRNLTQLITNHLDVQARRAEVT